MQHHGKMKDNSDENVPIPVATHLRKQNLIFTQLLFPRIHQLGTEFLIERPWIREEAAAQQHVPYQVVDFLQNRKRH